MNGNSQALASTLVLVLSCPPLAASKADTGPEAVVSASEEESAALDLYTPPEGKDLKTPVYPRAPLNRNMEGWVRLNFMVDPQGKAYEIAVDESMGHPDFERAAIRALERSTYEPARIDGRPSDAGYATTFIFQLSNGSKGASQWFAKIYRALTKAVEDGDRTTADKLLAKLEEEPKRNLYEDAYLHIGKHAYYANWGDERQQLDALDRAVAHKFAEEHLPQHLLQAMHRARFVLLLKTKDFERAIQTFKLLEGYDLEESVVQALQNVLDDLAVVKADESIYSVPGDFKERTSWSYHLFKDEFYFMDVQGEIEEIKLRCPTKYVFFRFDPEIEYKIANNVTGSCHLELVGSPGTTFTLVQK